MSYGLQVFNADGSVNVDFSSRITRIIYSTVLPAASSGFLYPPGFDASRGVAVVIGLTNDKRKAAHQIRQYGGTVEYRASMINETVYPEWPADMLRTDSVLMVFMYG